MNSPTTNNASGTLALTPISNSVSAVTQLGWSGNEIGQMLGGLITAVTGSFSVR